MLQPDVEEHNTMPTLSKQQLHDLTAGIFRQAGAPEDLADQVAEVLVDNHLAGHDSHGILRIPEYLKSIADGEIVPTARPEVIQETPSSALVQGHWALGQATGIFAADLAIAKAKAHQVAVVSVVQAAHTGRLAAFTDRAARQDVVMFMAIGTVDRPMTAPFGGAAAILGTNPVAFSIPNPDGDPITLDIATSAIAAGKVKVAKARHEELPPDVILDKHGNPTVNPQDFIDGGFLLPFGGHKGYALAVIAELLSGPLIGAESFSAVTQRSGIFIFAMNADLFRAKPDYARALAARLGQIKAVPPAPGFKEVLVPGEPEARMRSRRERDGIPIPDDTWQAVVAAARTVGYQVQA
jgi:LDH2 family malate/lactate/ureidoglycolate dehydrogenase